MYWKEPGKVVTWKTTFSKDFELDNEFRHFKSIGMFDEHLMLKNDPQEHFDYVIPLRINRYGWNNAELDELRISDQSKDKLDRYMRLKVGDNDIDKCYYKFLTASGLCYNRTVRTGLPGN